jgi:hypothetical protein
LLVDKAHSGASKYGVGGAWEKDGRGDAGFDSEGRGEAEVLERFDVEGEVAVGMWAGGRGKADKIVEAIQVFAYGLNCFSFGFG